MSKDFLGFIPFLWEWEGTVYENDPDDAGGATKFGIDQRSHPKENIKNLTEQRAKEIYWEEYWLKNGCDKMDKQMAYVFFDTCVNCGRSRADKCRDGNDPWSMLDNRDAFYRRLADARPKSKKYLKGWLARTSALRKLIR